MLLSISIPVACKLLPRNILVGEPRSRCKWLDVKDGMAEYDFKGTHPIYSHVSEFCSGKALGPNNKTLASVCSLSARPAAPARP
ncbi:hypothetical protein EVAR_42554_1 [Eumeta japonica]|uniref:Uncharacterized protein n=1 Tax=Eumeta variegata TaxID=151549 RepID=A0A4C1WUW4_EUMVA|nr:hypothetical protein EVAR_42554_1 [Eumeta japonica]